MPPEQNLPTPVVSQTHLQNRVWLIVLIIVVVVVLIGAGAYLWFIMHHAKKAAPVINTPAIEQVHKAALQALPANPSPKVVTTQEKMNILDSLTANPGPAKGTK